MQKTWEINDLSELNQVAREIISSIKPNKKIAFYGEMGAGKTTLIKELCLELGVEENTSSPTFAIVNEYVGKEKIYHFDLFRINSTDELQHIGFDEYLDNDAYIFIEWPQLIEVQLMGQKFAAVHIILNEDKKRSITLES